MSNCSFKDALLFYWSSDSQVSQCFLCWMTRCFSLYSWWNQSGSTDQNQLCFVWKLQFTRSLKVQELIVWKSIRFLSWPLIHGQCHCVSIETNCLVKWVLIKVSEETNSSCVLWYFHTEVTAGLIYGAESAISAAVSGMKIHIWCLFLQNLNQTNFTNFFIIEHSQGNWVCVEKTNKSLNLHLINSQR